LSADVIINIGFEIGSNGMTNNQDKLTITPRLNELAKKVLSGDAYKPSLVRKA